MRLKNFKKINLCFQVKSSQVKSSQVKSSQVKSSQVNSQVISVTLTLKKVETIKNNIPLLDSRISKLIDTIATEEPIFIFFTILVLNNTLFF